MLLNSSLFIVCMHPGPLVTGTDVSGDASVHEDSSGPRRGQFASTGCYLNISWLMLVPVMPAQDAQCALLGRRYDEVAFYNYTQPGFSRETGAVP